MNMSLISFCLSANQTIYALAGDKRLNAFFDYRYRFLADKFPHEPFSVGQSDLDFFMVTYQYLIGERDTNEIPKSQYNNNYINWIKANKQVKWKPPINKSRELPLSNDQFIKTLRGRT